MSAKFTYSVAAKAYCRWNGQLDSPVVIDDDMRRLINVVAEVIDSGLSYDDEVFAAVTARYSLTPEQLAAGKARVQNGDWGMEIYYARRRLEAERAAVKERETFERLSLTPGKNVGAIEVSANYRMRRFKNATVVSAEVGKIVVNATAGGRRYTMTMPAVTLADGISRLQSVAQP